MDHEAVGLLLVDGILPNSAPDIVTSLRGRELR